MKKQSQTKLSKSDGKMCIRKHLIFFRFEKACKRNVFNYAIAHTKSVVERRNSNNKNNM